jgi:hypothetical protein
MQNFTRVITTAATVTLLAATVTPLAAQTVAECYEKVLGMCNDALKECAWWEKPIVGAACTAMLVGCNTSVTITK